MPSPIAHAVSGYVIGKFIPLKQSKFSWSRRWEEILYPVVVATIADLDFIPQIITGEMFHRGLTHSLIFTIGFSAIASGIAYYFWKISYKQLFWFTLIIYSSHLFLDTLTRGRGIKFFFPFTNSFIKAPIEIFPGVDYSKGLWDYSHIFTIGFELLYSILLLGGLWLWNETNKSNKNKIN